MEVYRIQDCNGRGPFKPGSTWYDIDFAPGVKPLPTWMEEFGPDVIYKLGQAHEHFGTGVRSLDKLRWWFSLPEMRKLNALGYNIVRMKISRVLGESENQVLFARRKKLSESVIIMPWPQDVIAQPAR